MTAKPTRRREVDRRAADGCSSCRPAFTLLELLIVVAIIALLVGILLPSFSGAKRSARRTVCAKRLNQIGTGIAAYLFDRDGRFPEASFMPSVGAAPLSTPQPIRICDVLAPNLGNQLKVFQCPNDKQDPARLAPNTNKSFFQSEGSSYEYRIQFGGQTVIETVKRMESFSGRPVPENTIWIMRDYGNFHGKGGNDGARRYLYVDGHVSDYEN